MFLRSPDKTESVDYTLVSQDNGAENLAWTFTANEVNAGTTKPAGVINEITARGFTQNIFDADNSKVTWIGNAASVPFTDSIYGNGYGITFVFTIAQ